MKINKNLYLLILNIIYSLMIVGLWTLCVVTTLSGDFNIFLSLILFIISILGLTGMWLLYALPSHKAAVILLRIKSIMKVIVITCVLFVLMIILLAAQGCAHSLSGNEGEVPIFDKLQIMIPFILIFIFCIFHLVVYQILLSYINKNKINKPMLILTFIFNVLLCLVALLFGISSFLQSNNLGQLIEIDIVSDLTGSSKLCLFIVLGFYILYKGMSSFLLMKNIIKKKEE